MENGVKENQLSGKRGRPPKTTAVATPFSAWLARLCGNRGLDQRAAALAFGVSVTTVSNWLRGQDPKVAHLVKAGIVATLGLEQPSQGALAPGGKSSALREAPMPAPLREARDDLARIFFHYKPNSEEWRHVAGLIRLLAPRVVAPTTDDDSAEKTTRRRPP